MKIGSSLDMNGYGTFHNCQMDSLSDNHYVNLLYTVLMTLIQRGLLISHSLYLTHLSS